MMYAAATDTNQRFIKSTKQRRLEIARKFLREGADMTRLTGRAE